MLYLTPIEIEVNLHKPVNKDSQLHLNHLYIYFSRSSTNTFKLIYNDMNDAEVSSVLQQTRLYVSLHTHTTTRHCVIILHAMKERARERHSNNVGK